MCFSQYCRFGVTDEIVAPFLEGLTIQEAIEKKKLYYVDYKILENLPVKSGTPVISNYTIFWTLLQIVLFIYGKLSCQLPLQQTWCSFTNVTM